MKTKTGTLILLAFVFLAANGYCQIDDRCRQIIGPHEQAVDYKQLALVASSVLKDAKTKPISQDCITEALSVLGRSHDASVIPVLMDWLTWERTQRNSYKLELPGDKYPAIGALQYAGEPAVPALLDTIAKARLQSQLAQNALQAFMSIYRTNPAAGLKRLTSAASKQKGTKI